MFDVPVLFLVFNRPDTARQIFERIREAQPKQLFVAADGPRVDKPGEQQKTEEVRKLIIDNIDWDCEVKTLFRDQNLGCGKAVGGAISWFFEHVEQGIILEDDTLVDLSFFKFSEELLARYKDNEQVMMISAFNGIGHYKSQFSYSFSMGGGIWGWASWRRAWQKFDPEMKNYPAFREKMIEDITPDNKQDTMSNISLYDSVAGDNPIDTWDIQWNYSMHYHNGFTIWPHTNMVRNIGFGDGATHTFNKRDPYVLLKQLTMPFPLGHPPLVEDSQGIRQFLTEKMLNSSKESFIDKVKNKLRLVLKRIKS